MSHDLPTGLFTSRDARQRGIHPETLARLVRAGHIRRVARGVHIRTDVWAASERDQRRLLLIEATLLRRPKASASHMSALALHGLPLIREREKRIDVVDDVAQSVRRVDAWVHPRPQGSSGGRAVDVALALAQVASLGWRETAVAAADAALREEAATVEQLREAATRVPRPACAAAILASVDGRMESPGESLTRLVLQDLGCRVEPQVEFTIEGRRFRVDFVVTHPRWPGAEVIVEFDGQTKYVDDDGSALFSEKRREDLLRRQGHHTMRVVWGDFAEEKLIAERLWQAFAGRLAA